MLKHECLEIFALRQIWEHLLDLEEPNWVSFLYRLVAKLELW
jgi:hypothetical protein